MTTEDVSGQVPALLTTQRTCCDYPRVRHGLDWGRDVFSASLAHHGVVANLGWRQIPHAAIIGEY
ncbi:MAG: hypothetical protein WB608_20730 [Terracidiphilus sp.]